MRFAKAAAREPGGKRILGIVIVGSGGIFAKEVLRLTNNEGVHVVYDGAGADTFHHSLASLRITASWPMTVRPLNACLPWTCWICPKASSLPIQAVMDHARTHDALLARTGQFFDWVRKGTAQDSHWPFLSFWPMRLGRILSLRHEKRPESFCCSRVYCLWPEESEADAGRHAKGACDVQVSSKLGRA